MHFPNPIDVKLLDALFSENVLTRSLFQSWDKPKEEDHLSNLLLDNAETINPHAWISYLLKTGRVYRYNNPTMDGAIYHDLLNPQDYPDVRPLIRVVRAFIDTPYYPLRITGEALWIGVMRVDTITDTDLAKDFSSFKKVFLCAITPMEAAQIIKDLVKYVKQEFRTNIPPRTEVRRGGLIQ